VWASFGLVKNFSDNLQSLEAAACSKQKYGTFVSRSSKKQYTVVQLVWTIVLAKKEFV